MRGTADVRLSERRAWAEVDLRQLEKNYLTLKERVGPGVGVVGVVKADAYGHGAEQVARKLESLGAPYLATATVTEAVALRRVGIKVPILVLVGSLPGQERNIVKYDLTPSVYTYGALERLSQEAGLANKTALCHIKVDTGLGRLGVEPGEVLDFLKRVKQLGGLVVEGIFTHLASADDLSDDTTSSQVAIFSRVISEIEDAGFQVRYKHAANSAGILFHPESWFNLVRPGVALYGVSPNEQNGRVPVEPILTYKARIALVKAVPRGTPLGYGHTFVTRRPSVIATVAVGYADGLNRLLSNRGRVIVRGKFAPIVGNISMDLTLIDVTDIPGVSIGDEAVIIGRDGEASITAWDIARSIGTIPYEVLTNIGKRVTRVYVE